MYRYDAGEVVAGEVVSHAFTVMNAGDETIRIHTAEDVQKDCGCSGLTPEDRVLEPGASTKVLVTVNTAQKVGAFADGGSITWHTPAGEKRRTSFKIRGRAQPAVVSDPSSLAFDPDEVKSGATKEVRFTENVPVDWENTRVAGSEPLVKVVGWRVSDGGAVCKVRCHVPEGVEAANGGVTLCAPLAKPPAGLPSITVWVPVAARQGVEFTVTPSVVMVSTEKGSGRSSAKLLVQGRKLASSSRPITAITCEGYKAEWRMTEPTEGQTAIVFVDLKPAGKRTSGERPALVIEVEGMEPVRLPVVGLPPPAQ